jgi:tRNA threonylcarbamoyladenosine biosynthesis protein TsaB
VAILLALDTATDTCSTALLREGQVTARVQHAGHAHTTYALAQVDGLLRDAGIGLHQCDAFVFGAGPGSFTGLRVACALTQGLAWAVERPVIAVGNLLAMAWAAWTDPIAPVAGHAEPGSAQAAGRVLAAVDARLGELYWAVYEKKHATGAGAAATPSIAWRELAAPALAARADLAALLERFRPDRVALDAATAAACAPGAQRAGGVPRVVAVTAGALLGPALVLLGHGAAVPAAHAAPLYVRDRVALTVAERLATTAPVS